MPTIAKLLLQASRVGIADDNRWGVFRSVLGLADLRKYRARLRGLWKSRYKSMTKWPQCHHTVYASNVATTYPCGWSSIAGHFWDGLFVVVPTASWFGTWTNKSSWHGLGSILKMTFWTWYGQMSVLCRWRATVGSVSESARRLQNLNQSECMCMCSIYLPVSLLVWLSLELQQLLA